MFIDRRDRRKEGGSSLLIGFLLLGVLYFAREVFIPLALAGLVAFLLAPVANRLERWGLQRTLAGLLVIGLSFASVAAVGWVVLGQVYNLAVELPQYQQNVTQKIDALHLHSAGKLTSTVKMLADVSKQISTGSSEEPLTPLPVPSSRHRRSTPVKPALATDPASKTAEPIAVRVEDSDASILTVASRQIQPLIHPLTTAFIVVVFVIFMLLGRDDLRDRAVRLAGSTRIHITTVAMTDAGARVSRYLLMQFCVNMTYGGVVGLALWIIGVPHPLLWAVTTFLLRFIPYIGILAAGAGPLLVAIAVSPRWTTAAWTFGVYVAMELISANAVEPYLYGSSTGISALAILIAAIFWTWLWGLAGLLLSTPLTVCLIVIGRHVPRLEFLGVLFGEETVLEPSQRLYQRILASDASDAGKLLDEQMQTKSREEVYDTVLIPALSLIEEARHSEEINASRAEQALQSLEELADEQWRQAPRPPRTTDTRHRMISIPARDFADEITCQLLMHVVSDSYRVRLLSADLLSSDVLDTVAANQPDVVCVIGIPPQAIRHVRLRCHQLRTRFPDMVVVAGVLSTECDLSNIRGRIPMEDAQHVACSLLQASEYLTALANPAAAALSAPAPAPAPANADAGAAQAAVEGAVPEIKALDALDETHEDIFDQIAKNLAKTFEAPIAIVRVRGDDGVLWKAQCGLPEEHPNTSSVTDGLCDQSIAQNSCLVLADVAEDERFRNDPFVIEKGIRFYAGAPVISHDGTEIGTLCVLDTRPRQITDHQKEVLLSLADSVMNAIELRSTAVDPH